MSPASVSTSLRPNGIGVLKRVLMALMTLFLVSACGEGAYTHRFRLVVEVLVDGEVKSGYSVIEVVTWDSSGLGFSEAAGIRSIVRGEAAFVDLGAKGNVVALLRLAPPLGMGAISGLAQGAFEIQHPGLSWKQVSSLKGQAELVDRLRPYLISFADPTDPASAKVVPPDAFSTVFGPGVALRRIYIEMTDEPLHSVLEKRLPWVTDGSKALEAWKAIEGRGFEAGGSIGPAELFIRRDG